MTIIFVVTPKTSKAIRTDGRGLTCPALVQMKWNSPAMLHRTAIFTAHHLALLISKSYESFNDGEV
jgi:hypothetical protein